MDNSLCQVNFLPSLSVLKLSSSLSLCLEAFFLNLSLSYLSFLSSLSVSGLLLRILSLSSPLSFRSLGYLLLPSSLYPLSGCQAISSSLSLMGFLPPSLSRYGTSSLSLLPCNFLPPPLSVSGHLPNLLGRLNLSSSLSLFFPFLSSSNLSVNLLSFFLPLSLSPIFLSNSNLSFPELSLQFSLLSLSSLPQSLCEAF
ncbi:unnamed protein product [Acanthosepion pharaonis]|uniref:Uncharacterized protein n=1 Tax=Acanthosepion pharaonis TaxID=158019 RepID=A0A812DY25_ACAPH|nr:unnamed protein product [Sepia pharaonis]